MGSPLSGKGSERLRLPCSGVSEVLNVNAVVVNWRVHGVRMRFLLKGEFSVW